MTSSLVHTGPADLSRAMPRAAPLPRRVDTARAGRRASGLRTLLCLMIALAPILPAVHEPVAWSGMAFLSALTAAAWLSGAAGTAPVRPSRRIGTLLLVGAVAMAIPIAYQTLAMPGWPLDSVPEVIALAGAGAFLFTAAQNAAAKRRMFRPAPWVFATAVVVAGWALAFGPTGSPGHPGLTGPFANRNGFALFLSFGMIAGIHLRRQATPDRSASRMARVLAAALTWMGIGTLVLALAMTQSRVGAVSLIVGLMAYAVLGRGPGRRVTLRALFVAAAIGVVAVAPLADRFGDLGRDMAARQALYQQVWQLIRAEPIWGQGAGRFEIAFQRVLSPPVDPGRVWDHAHSGILNLWVEFGLIAGSVPLVGGAALLAWLAWRAWCRRDNAAATAVAALTVTAGHTLTDFSIENPTNTLFLLSLLALGLQPGRRRKGSRHGND